MMERRRQSYTLVEMLVVIAIATVLMAAMLPSFTKMLAGSGVNAAAVQLGNALTQAQSQAVAARRHVALMIAVNTPSFGPAYRSFRPCYVNSSNEFQSWLPDSKWEFLPVGTLICDADKTSAIGVTNMDTSVSFLLTVIGGSYNQTSNERAFVFSPYGNTLTDGGKFYIAVAAGSYEGGNFIFPSRDGSGHPVNVRKMEINGFTGRLRYVD